MEYKFFYFSIAAIWILLLFSYVIRPIKLRHIIIGITASGFSLFFDSFFGVYAGLYHYMSGQNAILFMILSALLVYPELDIIYLLFLPKKIKAAVIYTAVWLVAMVIFEISSLKVGTIVFTGWQMVPWSIVVYIFNFLWMNCFYRYLSRVLNQR